MIDLHIGKHGVVLIVLMFVLLTAEDVFVWLNSGVLPGVEFFVGVLVVLGIVVFAIRESRLHPPPGGD